MNINKKYLLSDEEKNEKRSRSIQLKKNGQEITGYNIKKKVCVLLK